MLLRLDGGARQCIAFIQVWQDAVFFVIAFLSIAAFLIDSKKAIKSDNGTGSAQRCLPVRRGNIGGDLIHNGGFHLAGDGAFPDQLVKLALIVIQVWGDIGGLAHNIRRANGFVRFLGVFRFSFIDARRSGNIV